MASYRARSLARSVTGAVVLLWLCAAHGMAQTSRLLGLVSDSATRKPVTAAVVIALDAAGNALGRTITNDRGVYWLQVPPTAVMIRALRIGYRAGTVQLSAPFRDLATVDIALATLPVALPAMEVDASRGCPTRADRDEAFSLLDQARAGLLATVVARENVVPQLLVLRFEKFLDVNGLAVERQMVRMDSSANASTSFNAVRSAVDFVSGGFRSGQDGRYTYYGPDAEVLLDERFQRGYCFAVAPADTSRPTQAGLHFAAASHRSGRVDIDGTLWIDTAARALHDIEFRYVGVEPLAESFNAGGRVNFRTLPNGVPFIDRWSLRLVGSPPAGARGAQSVQQYAIREVGGELARAHWPDGEVWFGPQSTVHVTAVMRDGRPAARTPLNLLDTDYRATTDSAGRATFQHVLPGSFTIAVDDPTLAPIGIQIPAGRTLAVGRSAAVLTRVTVATAIEHVAALCGSRTLPPAASWLVARVTESDGTPAAGVHWRASKGTEGSSQSLAAPNGRYRVVADNAATAADGLVLVCDGLVRNAAAELAVWRDPRETIRVRRMLDDPLTVAHVPLPSAVVAVSKPAVPDAVLVAHGTVRDSITGAAIPDARVTFLGTPFEGASDPSGNFVVGGLTAGSYTVEVSTPWLDSLGVVARRSVVLAAQPAALDLLIPTHAAILQSTCGLANASGFVVGRVLSQRESIPPSGLRIIAEWNELGPLPANAGAAAVRVGGLASKSTATGAATRVAWSEGAVTAAGTFRVCGLPTDTRVVLRTESDSVTPWGSAPHTLALAPDRLFARVDLQLDSANRELSTLTGVVLGDSAGVPLQNVEVAISDLGRSAFTDRRGAFRMSDLPVGPHLLTVRRMGFAPFIEPVNVLPNQVVEQRVLLGRMSALPTVAVGGEPALREFEARRATGVGRFLARADLEKHRGRRLGEVLTQVTGFGASAGGSGHMWVVGTRAPAHITPRSTGPQSVSRVESCGASKSGSVGAPAPCGLNYDEYRAIGMYCPTMAERTSGLLTCACFSQVYVDGRLMNTAHPTEPFDANTIPIDDIEGVEFYATAASTPGRYSSLNAQCGVMLVWTRR